MNEKTLFETAREYERKKLLKSTILGDFTLFCYTQDTFFSKDAWDSITKTHRGKLYYKGVPVNKPFEKIFNLNEVEDTSLALIEKKMLQESFDIYDKANGHLFIVSCFVDDEGESRFMFHTKGSLPGEGNDLLNKDIELFLSMHGNQISYVCEKLPVATYMFEAVVEHDKHTMYEQQCKQYDIESNAFILLGANIMEIDYDNEYKWFECDYSSLKMIADVLGCKLVNRYNIDSLDSNIMTWFNHTDVEGYVIHFKDGQRVKIKTKEYWLLRFRKDLNADNILRMFNSAGFDRLHLKLPEEVATKIQEVITLYFDEWYFNHHVKVKEIDENVYKLDRKEIAQSKDLTTEQKTYIFSVLDNKVLDLTRSTTTRFEFIKFMNCNTINKHKIQDNIEKIVSTIDKLE